jgi:hypothetical protein
VGAVDDHRRTDLRQMMRLEVGEIGDGRQSGKIQTVVIGGLGIEIRDRVLGIAGFEDEPIGNAPPVRVSSPFPPLSTSLPPSPSRLFLPPLPVCAK